MTKDDTLSGHTRNSLSLRQAAQDQDPSLGRVPVISSCDSPDARCGERGKQRIPWSRGPLSTNYHCEGFPFPLSLARLARAAVTLGLARETRACETKGKGKRSPLPLSNLRQY